MFRSLILRCLNQPLFSLNVTTSRHQSLPGIGGLLLSVCLIDFAPTLISTNSNGSFGYLSISNTFSASCTGSAPARPDSPPPINAAKATNTASVVNQRRSEEHTSELQSPCNLVCR